MGITEFAEVVVREIKIIKKGLGDFLEGIYGFQYKTIPFELMLNIFLYNRYFLFFNKLSIYPLIGF